MSPRSDFQNFSNSSGVRPSPGLDAQILGAVRADLAPSAWQVFAKVVGLHALGGALTLTVCPQFGLELWDVGLMNVFMNWGALACDLACGALFTTLGFTLVVAFLRQGELRVLRRHPARYLAATLSLSVGLISLMSPLPLAQIVTIGWVLGAFVAARAVLETGWRLRLRLAPSAL